jgi:hypothetical protein
MNRFAFLTLSTVVAAGCGGGASSTTGTGGATSGSASSTSTSSTSTSSTGSTATTGSTTTSSSTATTGTGTGGAGGAPPEAHEWDTAGSFGGPGFGTFTCTFTVPDPPPYTQQSVFLWCGVQQASGVTPSGDSSFGVLQPVLMFGPDCVQDLPEGAGFGPGNDPTYDANPYWYYSSQYVYPSPKGSVDYQCTSGTVFKAAAGDVLVSTFTISANGATVSMVGPNGAGNSTLSSASPWDQTGQSWGQFLGSGDQIIVEAAVEAWNVTSTSQWPPALLSGWSVASSISPPSGLSDAEWELEPWNNGSLKVSCSHAPSSDGSSCTWSQ